MTGRSLVRIQVGPPDRRRERRSSSEVEQGTHKPLAADSHPTSATGLAKVVKLVDTQSSAACELLLLRVRIPPSTPPNYAPRSAHHRQERIPQSLFSADLPIKHKDLTSHFAPTSTRHTLLLIEGKPQHKSPNDGTSSCTTTTP